ncbi:GNAT family N-acetyltransferase [Streptomyces sp. NPDC090077]|uniref:GNAT family N-acetyltransferase n=1 Tax=Streptomyces sp. NPDC090077 TaxID=3365938 RepID=UPI0038251AFF
MAHGRLDHPPARTPRKVDEPSTAEARRPSSFALEDRRPPAADHSDVLLRRAVDTDAHAAAEVWLRSFAQALPTVRCAHSDHEIRDWFAKVLVPQQETWVAVAENTVVGVMVLKGEELKQLYLDPAWRGQGLGDRFTALAKRQQPDGLTLWTFQANTSAQGFYERHGFTAVEQTDGQRNDEHEPDTRYTWQPTGHPS